MMQEKLGQPIVVENKTGASGVIGATSAWRAEPDGYTLLVNALADVQNLHYIPVPYNAVDDFALIGQITDGPPLVLIVNAKLPYKSLAELIADAKANPSKISFGTSGPATSPVIALTQLNALAGTKIVGRALSRLGPGRRRGGDGRSPGRLRVLFAAPSRCRTTARSRALAVASPQRLRAGRTFRPWTSSAFPASIIAASSASRRRARRRRRSSPSSTSTLNDAIRSDVVQTDAWSRSA